MEAIVLNRQRIRHAAASEHKPLLTREEGDLVDPAKRFWMRASGEETRFEQRGRAFSRDRTVAHPAFRAFDFDERFKPEKAARAVAHDGQIDPAPSRFRSDCACDRVGADRKRRRVGGNEDACGH